MMMPSTMVLTICISWCWNVTVVYHWTWVSSCWIGTGGGRSRPPRQKFSVTSVGVIFNQLNFPPPTNRTLYMNFLCQGFRKLSSDRYRYRQTRPKLYKHSNNINVLWPTMRTYDRNFRCDILKNVLSNFAKALHDSRAWKENWLDVGYTRETSMPQLQLMNTLAKVVCKRNAESNEGRRANKHVRVYSACPPSVVGASISYDCQTVGRYNRSYVDYASSVVVELESRLHPVEARLFAVQVITQRPSSNWRTHKVVRRRMLSDGQCLPHRPWWSVRMPDLRRWPQRPVFCLLSRLLFFCSIQSIL